MPETHYPVKRIPFFISYYESMKDLPPELYKKLMNAIFEFAFYSKEPRLSGEAKRLFTVIRPNIEKSIELSQTRSNQGRKGGAPKGNKNASKSNKNKQKQAEKDADEDEDMDEDMDEEEALEEMLLHTPSYTELGPTLKNAILKWIKYKYECDQSITATSLASLISQVTRHTNDYGETAVVQLIDLCISNSWKTIVWEKLEEQHGHKSYISAIDDRMQVGASWLQKWEEE